MKLKNLTAAVSTALALAAAAPAFATDIISYDRDGAGGTGSVLLNQFDWSADSALAVGLAFSARPGGPATFTSGVNDTFTLYIQGRLANFVSFDTTNAGEPLCTPDGGGGSTCSNITGTETTFVLGVSMKLNAAAGTGAAATSVSFTANYDPTANGGAPVNFFKIYYDSVANVDTLHGTGYDDGKEILSAQVLSPGAGDTNFGMDLNLGSALRKMDSTGSDQWNGSDAADADGSGYARQAVGTYESLSGDVFFEFAALSQDNNFFKSIINKLGIGLNFATQATDPFSTVSAPSERVAGTAGANPDFGTDTKTGSFTGGTGGASSGTRVMNDFSCANSLATAGTKKDCDFMFQVDGTSVFANAAPEPSSLAIIGAALGAFGVAARRRRKA